MTSPTSSSIGIPSGDRRGSRRVSAAVLHELEEPRPPGGWNSLERFASSYQRSTTFFRIDASSPGSSIGFYGSHRPGIPGFVDDVEDSAILDDDEETGLLSSRGSRRGTQTGRSQSDLRGDHDGEVEDHFALFRGHGGPKPGDELYGSIGRESRRASMLVEHGVPELLIKEIEDEAGNIIEVVIGQVANSRKVPNRRVPKLKPYSILSISW